LKINVYALSRSGHHAIAFWLAKNLVPNPTVKVVYSGGEKELEVGDKDTILELHENEKLPEHSEPAIIILRDPYNNFASFYKIQNNANYGSLSFFPFLEYWVAYAKEAGGDTNFLKNKVVIAYNQWVNSEDYRKQVVNEIGLKFHVKTQFNDSVKNHMTVYGGGSSFDGLNFVRSADQMKVHERYKNYEQSLLYRNRVDTHEMKVLSEKLFKFYPWVPVEKPRRDDRPQILEDFFK